MREDMGQNDAWPGRLYKKGAKSFNRIIIPCVNIYADKLIR